MRRSRAAILTLFRGGSLLFALVITGCGEITDVGTKRLPEAPASDLQPLAQFGPFPAGTTVFVDVNNTTGLEDGTQANPFNTIQEAIAASSDGDQVGLAAGVYAEIFGVPGTPNYVIDSLRDFRLVGMGPARTIIRGDHSFSLIRVQGGGSALIKDVTIEEGGLLQHSEGGGIQVLGHAAPISLKVENVVLQSNEAVNGAAIAVDGDVQLELINVLIAKNRASNCCGGILLSGTGATVVASVRNTTVTDNFANFSVGGIMAERATLYLVNSIVWNNSLTEVGTFAGQGVLNVSFSDVGESLFPGQGNISVDPLFIAPAAGEYRLQSGSAAIDAGGNAMAPMTDLDGKPRPIDGDGDGAAVVDMGAYEFGSPAPPAPFCAGLQATIYQNANSFWVLPPSASATPLQGGGYRIAGTSAADVIVGTGADDVILPAGGNDVTCGGSGNDVIEDGAGDDRVFGDAGNDRLYGGTGTDRIEGGDGNDRIVGGSGNDELFGGPGDDMLFGSQPGSLPELRDSANGGSGADACEAFIVVACES